ncbi:MAG: hypothetical protein AAF401_09705 [Pseudomonadota bacterium]
MINPTPATLFASLPSLIADRLSAVAPQLRECAVHESRLTLEEIMADRLKTPSIRVVLLGSRPKAPLAGSYQRHELAFAAYVITKDQKGLARDEACLTLSQAVMLDVQVAKWDDEHVGAAENVRMESLSDSATRKKGIALRAVLWTLPVELTAGESAACPLPQEVYLGFDPEIGAAHEDDYVQISGEPE